MITSRDEKRFSENMLEHMPNFLQEAIDWLQDNANPDDVFTDGKLEDWAVDNGFVKQSND